MKYLLILILVSFILAQNTTTQNNTQQPKLQNNTKLNQTITTTNDKSNQTISKVKTNTTKNNNNSTTDKSTTNNAKANNKTNNTPTQNNSTNKQQTKTQQQKEKPQQQSQTKPNPQAQQQAQQQSKKQYNKQTGANSINNTNQQQQVKQQIHNVQIIKLEQNVQVILPQPTPIPSQTIEGQVDGEAVNYKKAQSQRIIQFQISRTKQNAKIDYSHIKEYAFLIKNIQIFYIKPDHDTDFMCQFNLYWEKDNTFVESAYQAGQQLRIIVQQNRRMVHADEFFKSHGFTIRAKKGNTYTIRLVNKGYNKLITMISSNYLEENKMTNKINVDVANEHELQIQKMKNTIRTFLGVAQRNMVINEQIAYNVTLHTKRYMSYQIIEMLMMICGAAIQIYLTKRLLNPHSIV